MERDSYEEGVPSWVDLSSPDPVRSAEFYAALFGWDTPEGPPEAGGYRVCTLKGRTVAGIGPQMSPGPPAWSTYVNVADADARTDRATAAGAKVLAGPFDVLDAGRMAFVADPTGAVIGMWQPGSHPGAGIVNEPGSWCWSELVSTDVDASLAFYPKVFGWEYDRTPPEGPVQYVEWKVGGNTMSGMMPKPPMMPAEVPAFWGVYFAVSDADAAAAQISALGGSIVVPPSDIEPGRFAVASDPTGAAFNILALRSEA